jgi:predicted dehydrogenase
MSDSLSLAILGCGSRGRTYAKIAASFGDRYRLAAAADLVEVRREAVAALAPAGAVRTFDCAEALFEAGKLADVLIIIKKLQAFYRKTFLRVPGKH